MDGARNGVVVPIWSPLIISEANRVLTWLWLKRANGDQSEASKRRLSDDSKVWFSKMTKEFFVVDDRPPYEEAWTDNPADVWDIPQWTAAIRAQQQYRGAPVCIVTANLKDGPPKDNRGLQRHRGVAYFHPEGFARLIDAWADLMYTGEPRRRPRRAERPSAGEALTSQPAGVALPGDIEEFLRTVSARLPKSPPSPDHGTGT